MKTIAFAAGLFATAALTVPASAGCAYGCLDKAKAGFEGVIGSSNFAGADADLSMAGTENSKIESGYAKAGVNADGHDWAKAGAMVATSGAGFAAGFSAGHGMKTSETLVSGSMGGSVKVWAQD
ncbi:hypothetical protein N9L26_02115 [Candidatus Pacebacteria bacterium]|nr:hypothetical protein [Candidatus Paceibacterota bacterium]